MCVTPKTLLSVGRSGIGFFLIVETRCFVTNDPVLFIKIHVGFVEPTALSMSRWIT